MRTSFEVVDGERLSALGGKADQGRSRAGEASEKMDRIKEAKMDRANLWNLLRNAIRLRIRGTERNILG